PISLTSSAHITDNIVRAGLNYKFSPALGPYDTGIGIGVPSIYKAPPLKAPTYGLRAPWTWAGFYLGGNIGYAWGKSNTDTMFGDRVSGGPLFAVNSSNRLDGAIGGAQAGYNFVAGNLLAGIEADLNYSSQRGGLASTCSGAICNPVLVGVVADPSVQAIFEQGQKLEWFATMRGRLGVAVTPDAVASATGGLAVGEIMTAGTVFGLDGDGNAVN